MKLFINLSNFKKSWLHIFRIGVALSILIFLIASTSVESILNTFKTINPLWGGISGCCLIAFFLLGGFNVWILLRTMHTISFSSFLNIYSYSWALSLVTPGQVGDASLILFLKKCGIQIRQTGIAYIIDKIITITFFFLISWLGSYLFLGILQGIWLPLIMTVIALIGVGFMLFWVFPHHFSFATKIRNWIDDLVLELHIFKNQWYILLINIMLTAVKWGVLSLCYFTAFYAFNVFVKWPEIGIIPILASLVGYIPVSISGIGTVEFTATFLFSKIGVTPSVVLSVYLFLRTLQFIMALILIASLKFFKTTK